MTARSALLGGHTQNGVIAPQTVGSAAAAS